MYLIYLKCVLDCTSFLSSVRKYDERHCPLMYSNSSDAFCCEPQHPSLTRVCAVT